MFLHALLACLLSAGVSVQESPSPVSFDRERIVFHVRADSCIVDASYWFVNTSDKNVRQNLLYPFPIRPDLPYPAIEQVVDVSKRAQIPFSRLESALLFQISIPPRAETEINVAFRQPTPSREMEYILTSTQAWKRPLRSAEFVIITPRFRTLSRCTYDPTETAHGPEADTVIIRRTEFFPTKNLLFSWRRAK